MIEWGEWEGMGEGIGASVGAFLFLIVVSLPRSASFFKSFFNFVIAFFLIKATQKQPWDNGKPRNVQIVEGCLFLWQDGSVKGLCFHSTVTPVSESSSCLSPA